jgi:NCS1 family nucleobase:cation symporter-1
LEEYASRKVRSPPRLPLIEAHLFHSAAITSQAVIGFVIYFVVFLFLLLIHPSKLRWLVWPAAIIIAVVFLGLLGWAVSANGGTVGNLLAGKIHLSSTNKSFAMLYAISSAAGSSTAFSSRISDWTRFAHTKHAATVPMLVFAPCFGCIGPVFGILATSAVYSRYQVVEWNPLGLLLYVQHTQYTAACRAATFFAGLGLFCAILMV